MVSHVYSYFCEDTYSSRMGTNWMQNTDVEVGFVNKAQRENTDRRGVWCLNMKYFSDILNCWDNTYKAIDFANQCIKGIAESERYAEGDKDMKQLLGEAYCLRAYWYWMLCNFWGDVPFATTPSTKDDMHNDPRTDKNIIYTHCIQDLINIEEDMQWSSEIGVEYMNREFALGFIAKLAMFRAGYSMQADGTMARCNETGEEYTVTYKDENGNETTDTVRTYEYDRIYNFLKAKRAYTVSYETNGGTAAINSSNTDAPGIFNGWNEQLTEQTSHGEVKGWDGWSVGTWNWAAYYNGNPDLLRATNNTYDTMWAILHYREHGIDEGRTFNGASYWLPAVAFKNLTANGGTVNVKADYTNGTVTLPNAEKASVEIDGKNVSYTFDGWYLDSALTSRVGGAGDTYTPAGNTTLYAKYTTQSENLIFNQKIRVRYENADGTWTSYTTVLDQDFRTGDTVDYDFGSLDTDKWVRPAAVKYTVSGQYQTEGYTTSVDIYRQTYNVTVTYDNADAFSAKSGEGTYRWGENVTASVTLSEKTAQYTYRFAGFETDSRLTFRNGTTAASNPVTFVMPEENVTLKACSASQTNEYTVTVEHYYMDTSGNYPDKPSVAEALTPYYGETLVHKDLAREIKGLSFNENKTIQENGNRTQTEVKGNTTVRLYYDRSVCTVTYDYRTNGGTSADQETVKTYYGADADLSVAAYKNGWEHDGWNTKSDSETGLTRYTVTGNVTLYAVYRKDITVTFVDFAQTYKREGSMYNNDTYALIDAPQCSTYGGWENVSDVTAVGFNSRADITAEGAEKMEVKSGEEHLKIPDSITYYTVCSAAVTLSL